MATRLKTYDFTKVSRLTTADKATYPWDDWFDGDIWELKQGDDFDGHPLMMERIIRTRATGKQAKITMRHVPVNGDQWGTIILQRTDVIGPTEAKRRATTEKRAATRAEKGKKDAEVTKARTPRKPSVKKAGAVTKAPPKPVSKQVSKRPSKKVAATV